MSNPQDILKAKEILKSIDWATTLGVELEFALPSESLNDEFWYVNSPIIKRINGLEPKWSPQVETLIVPPSYTPAELASPVYNGRKEPKILEVAEVLQDSGAVVMNGAGLHIHAGLDIFSYKQWGNIERQMFANYVLVEPAMLFSYDRIHDKSAMRKSIRTGFNSGSYAEYFECAQNMLTGPIGHMNYLSKFTQSIFGNRHDKPYRTIEWKAPQATLCPIQIAANMKLWHDLFAFSARKALSKNPQELPQGGEFSELMHIARTYNNNMLMSDSFDIDDRVRLLTWDVDALEANNRI